MTALGSLKRKMLGTFYGMTQQWLSKSSPDYDLVLVIFKKSRGWILEAICQEVKAHFDGRITFHYSKYNLPSSKAYFFVHYYFFSECLIYNERVRNAANLIWFTHPREDIGADIHEIIDFVNSKKNNYILVPCTHNQEYLLSAGLKEEHVKVILGAADPNFFTQLSRRQKKTIGFCSAYYKRKRPDRIFGLIGRFPQCNFLLLGKGWMESPYAKKIEESKNLKYVESVYPDYPKMYAQMDVFVAPSDLEGGPIPLIEAMMSNVVPVACDTGFARDVIQHRKNGYIFSKDADLDEISCLIEDALNNSQNIRSSVELLSWESFSKQIIQLV